MELYNYPNPRYIFPGGRSMKTSQIPMFLHIAARVWGQHWHTFKHENSEVIYSSRNKSRKGMSGNSRLQKHEKHVIDFIWLNVQAKYLIQTISYHFKWDMTLWKWPKCPQYMQRTWFTFVEVGGGLEITQESPVVFNQVTDQVAWLKEFYCQVKLIRR